MTIQTDAAVPSSPALDSEFDLDVSIVESGPVVGELMRLTDDTAEPRARAPATVARSV